MAASTRSVPVAAQLLDVVQGTDGADQKVATFRCPCGSRLLCSDRRGENDEQNGGSGDADRESDNREEQLFPMGTHVWLLFTARRKRGAAPDSRVGGRVRCGE